MSTEFNVPSDDQWSEAPRGRPSRLSLGLGWLIVAAWTVSLAGYAAFELWRSRAVDGEALHLRRVDRLWPPVFGSAPGPTSDDEDRSLSGG